MMKYNETIKLFLPNGVNKQFKNCKQKIVLLSSRILRSKVTDSAVPNNDSMAHGFLIASFFFVCHIGARITFVTFRGLKQKQYVPDHNSIIRLLVHVL